ncbi:acyltransferase family protein [Catenovulum sp. SX2]|uniref:acyltransferase family protein n=1 Tax=Catenovulum sp. SX2 TaxID=3398614 RepID=UPI003F828495
MEPRRLTELDGLRGIAAIAVVLYHYLNRYHDIYGHSFNVPEILKFGQYGVHLFFIISGFVIYWTISKVDKPLDFIWSRASRLYPPFWFSVTITFLAVAMFSLPDREVSLVTFFFNLSMLHEYLGLDHVDGVYWTLTIELTFYFWIFVIFCLGKMEHIEKVLIFWICGALTFEFLGIDTVVGHRIRTFLLLDYIELFAAGICFYKYRVKTFSKLTHIIIILSILSLFVSYQTQIASILCCLYFLFGLAVAGKVRLLGASVFVYFGSISYSLYLIHQNVGYIIINKSYALDLEPFVGIIFAFGISLLLSHFILVFVERPSLAKLKAFYKQNKRIALFRNKLDRPARSHFT